MRFHEWQTSEGLVTFTWIRGPLGFRVYIEMGPKLLHNSTWRASPQSAMNALIERYIAAKGYNRIDPFYEELCVAREKLRALGRIR